MFDLFREPPIKPWKPVIVGADQWPVNYESVYAWRVQTLRRLTSNPSLLLSAKQFYALRPTDFIMDWCDTYDPRRAGNKWVPFVLFERQGEFVEFITAAFHDQENGLIEKSRDMGASWAAVCWSIHAWLFIDSVAIGWGSRKQELVDKIGDMSSIFEKLRVTVNRIPKCFRPEKYTAAFMKMVNHSNGATIVGEIGDNIGRGGRTSIYFKDESAHYERPELVEAALGDNTNVQMDISSVNGPGNVFHRKREAGLEWPEVERGRTRVFVMDWRDHPAKTLDWYETRRRRYVAEGLSHIFSQEVDRDYFKAVQNTIVEAQWIDAAIDLHLKVPALADGRKLAALDVADEGLDKNAFVAGQGQVTTAIHVWGERDTGVTARKAIGYCREFGKIDLFYDSIGVGSGVKAEYNRLREEDFLSHNIRFYPWNAGDSVQNPFERIIPNDDDSELNKDFYENVKAQAWWNVRNLFRRSWEYVNEGVQHSPDKMLSICSKSITKADLAKLKKELVQPVYKPSARLKMMVDKKPNGVASPNIADAFVMRYFPIYDNASVLHIGSQKL